MQVKATSQWFTDNQQRPMIISRSAFSGMGKFGSRWLGDNFSTQEYMGLSVTGVMAQNIAGFPLSGGDICGFNGNATAELCTRWYAVGAFQPFSRNHNNYGNSNQAPWSYQVQNIIPIRKAMLAKLSLMRYYQTEMTKLHLSGGTFYKPLFFSFPLNDGAYEAPQLNIMLGESLKLSV